MLQYDCDRMYLSSKQYWKEYMQVMDQIRLNGYGKCKIYSLLFIDSHFKYVTYSFSKEVDIYTIQLASS